MLRMLALTAALVAAVALTNSLRAAELAVSGELKLWHDIALSFVGPEEDEAGHQAEIAGQRRQISPFRDYRLTVTFTHQPSGRNYAVPGYFAADGNAAETGATKGNVWRVHFMPDATGDWAWQASFRFGSNVAVDDAAEGQPVAFDGAKGRLSVGPSDKTGRDFRGKGRLDHVDGRYLRFAGSGAYFLKGGPGSPENFLAYFEFDGTRRTPGAKPLPGEARVKGLHHYAPHAQDWREGDPTWQGGKGKNIIGAINYLASRGMNAVYFLTVNVGGDGKDVWPWTSESSFFAFDCSKLDQWEIVFSQMTRVGVAMDVITQEQENAQLLDGGDLGPARRLYYRELIARFAHHPAVTWNLGEETTNTDAQRKAFSTYIKRLDPYKHPIVAHTFPWDRSKVYTPLLGFRDFDGPSLQVDNQKDVHAETIAWLDRSAQAGRPWFACLDEIGPSNDGVKPDANDPEHREVRSRSLWGHLMAGGAGVDWYFGFQFPNNDLSCEDFRSREKMWDQTRVAHEFFHRHLPFAQMRHADELSSASDGYCFAKPGEVYAIYLPKGGTTELDLGAHAGAFSVKWFNPRSGSELLDGTVKEVRGPGKVRLSDPPAEKDKDWTVLVRRLQER